MTNLISFPITEVYSAPLGRELAGIRKVLHTSNVSNRVLEYPYASQYDPVFMPDGSMQLGVGIDDFRQRFEGCDIPQDSLYVVYAGLKKGLLDAKESDTTYHEGTLRACDIVRFRFRAGVEDNIIQERLIGYHAANLAMLSVTKYLVGQNPAIRSRKILELSCRAEKPLKINADVVTKKARENTLADFRFGVSGRPMDGINERLNIALRNMVKRRKNNIKPSEITQLFPSR